MAAFDYLPTQVYVPVGVIDQVAELTPDIHSHADSAVPWLHIDDDLPRQARSARTALHKATS